MKFEELYDSLIKKLTGWVEAFVTMLPNAAVAAVVMLIFWILSRVVSGLAERALSRIHTNRAARNLMTNFVRIAVLIAGVVVALGVLDLDKALASILTGAGIIGLALGFAFQDLAANLISGVGLAVHSRLPFQIGDVVLTNDVMGTVRHIHLRTSIIESLDGKMNVIPNKQIYQDVVTNYSANGKLRVDLECGISYGENLEKVKKVTLEAVQDVSGRDTTRDPEFFFSGFGDSSINFVTRFWVPYARHSDYLAAKSDALLRLKKAFDENDIMIPFPIRTLDFGIRGGVTLTEAWPSEETHDSNGTAASM